MKIINLKQLLSIINKYIIKILYLIVPILLSVTFLTLLVFGSEIPIGDSTIIQILTPMGKQFLLTSPLEVISLTQNDFNFRTLLIVTTLLATSCTAAYIGYSVSSFNVYGNIDSRAFSNYVGSLADSTCGVDVQDHTPLASNSINPTFSLDLSSNLLLNSMNTSMPFMSLSLGTPSIINTNVPMETVDISASMPIIDVNENASASIISTDVQMQTVDVNATLPLSNQSLINTDVPQETVDGNENISSNVPRYLSNQSLIDKERFIGTVNVYDILRSGIIKTKKPLSVISLYDIISLPKLKETYIASRTQYRVWSLAASEFSFETQTQMLAYEKEYLKCVRSNKLTYRVANDFAQREQALLQRQAEESRLDSRQQSAENLFFTVARALSVRNQSDPLLFEPPWGEDTRYITNNYINIKRLIDERTALK